jgi:hypothetical protein
MNTTSKFLIVAGIMLVLFGMLLSLGFKGLPGDISIKRENFSFYFPLATSILLSIILSLILYLLSRR